MKSISTKFKRKIIPLIFIPPLLLAGCSNIKAETLDVVEGAVDWVGEKASTYMDNHQYIAFPWHLFLTEEDREELNKPDIPILPQVAFDAYPVVDTIKDINKLIEETNGYVNNYDNYEENVDDETVLGEPLEQIYQHNDADMPFVEVLEDMYNRPWTFPNRVDMVMLEQNRENDNHIWTVHLEWKALQDSNEFLVYPMTLQLNEELQYIDSVVKKPINSPVYTKRLDEDSVVDDNTHQTFMVEWEDFKRLFNPATNTNSQGDTSHLNSIATDDMPLEVLERLYEASRGDLDNASITGWKMHDKDADALSLYILSIPVDYEENVARFEITYSRPYKEIISIKQLSN